MRLAPSQSFMSKTGASAHDEKKKKQLPVIIPSPQLSHSSRSASGNLTHLPIHYTVIQSPFYCLI